MDSLNYHYNKGTNQLNWIHDTVPKTNYPEDIDNETPNNYLYNSIGQLAKDDSGKIDTIIWTIYGKVKKIVKPSVRYSWLKDSIIYEYDPLGNRIEKRTYTAEVPSCTHCAPVPLTDTVLYSRDAQGNILAIYGRRKVVVTLTEWDIYGSKRVGVVDTDLLVHPYSIITSTSVLDSSTIRYEEGQKQYELTNHLGNVLVTISDKKVPMDTNYDGLADYYNPEIINAQDYYPFGMVEPGRQYAILRDSAYHYGFNGQLKDNEIYGKANAYTAENWEYDPRLGRRWNLDPIIHAGLSPYAAFADNPICFSDPFGDDTVKAGGKDAKAGDIVDFGKGRYTEAPSGTITKEDSRIPLYSSLPLNPNGTISAAQPNAIEKLHNWLFSSETGGAVDALGNASMGGSTLMLRIVQSGYVILDNANIAVTGFFGGGYENARDLAGNGVGKGDYQDAFMNTLAGIGTTPFGGEGEIAAASTDGALQAAADAAAAQAGNGSGAVYGTKVHTLFKAAVKDLGKSGFDVDAEVSYLNTKRVPYGTEGSVRADVILGNRAEPTMVYDLKTGTAKMTARQLKNYMTHLPPSVQEIKVIRPTQ
jgi:RHS repeat-associated protein